MLLKKRYQWVGHHPVAAFKWACLDCGPFPVIPSLDLHQIPMWYTQQHTLWGWLNRRLTRVNQIKTPIKNHHYIPLNPVQIPWKIALYPMKSRIVVKTVNRKPQVGTGLFRTWFGGDPSIPVDQSLRKLESPIHY